MMNSPTHQWCGWGACRGQWEVEALGQLGQGAADNYAPILESIRHLAKKRGCI